MLVIICMCLHICDHFASFPCLTLCWPIPVLSFSQLSLFSSIIMLLSFSLMLKFKFKFLRNKVIYGHFFFLSKHHRYPKFDCTDDRGGWLSLGNCGSEECLAVRLRFKKIKKRKIKKEGRKIKERKTLSLHARMVQLWFLALLLLACQC